MNDIATDLYNYIFEHTPPLTDDIEYQQALQTYMELEDEVRTKTGGELLFQYQRAESEVSHRQNVAVLMHSLRFEAHLMREILKR